LNYTGEVRKCAEMSSYLYILRTQPVQVYLHRQC